MTEIITHPGQLKKGDLMFGPIGGLAGVGVGLGQLFLSFAEPIMVFDNPRKWFKIRHTGVISEAATEGFELNAAYVTGIGPKIVQAMPGGAEEIELTYDYWNKNYVYIRPQYLPYQGDQVAAAAKGYINTPYDFATYGAIPLYRRGLHTKRIETIISDTSTMMCSRLVDKCLDDAEWHLFDDGRLPGDVTPSEVFRRTLQLPVAARTTLGALK